MSMEDLRVKIMCILSKKICNYANCSDGNNNQFPYCEEQSSKICSIHKFGVYETADKIMEEIQKYEVDIISLQGDTFPEPKKNKTKKVKISCPPPEFGSGLIRITNKNLIQEDLL